MAVIKSKQQLGQIGLQRILPILIGMLIGAMGMHLLHGGEDYTFSGSPLLLRESTNEAAVADGRSSSSLSSPPPGWHPIHVFYGEKSGLGAPDTQKWFAQVHQDEIVVDLVGKDGFFIDLAANDAKELTNTLSLERDYGWRGLCIEPNPGYWVSPTCLRLDNMTTSKYAV